MFDMFDYVVENKVMERQYGFLVQLFEQFEWLEGSFLLQVGLFVFVLNVKFQLGFIRQFYFGVKEELLFVFVGNEYLLEVKGIVVVNVVGMGMALVQIDVVDKFVQVVLQFL